MVFLLYKMNILPNSVTLSTASYFPYCFLFTSSLHLFGPISATPCSGAKSPLQKVLLLGHVFEAAARTAMPFDSMPFDGGTLICW